MKITGQITFISEVQEGTSDKGGWAKRTIVVRENQAEYPNEIVLTLFKSGEHIDYAKDKFTLKVGDNVEVEYNARANEYQGKWYGDNGIWKINKTNSVNQDNEPNDLKF